MICVIQFDAASETLVERMLAAGDLPSLAAATERGHRLELQTPARDFPAGAFYSLYSGVPVADHGIVYPFQWSAPEMRVRFADAFAAPSPVWERLAGSGCRVLVVDPYECRPPEGAIDLEGLVVAGWGFHERVVLPRWSHPAGALRGLERRHGRSPAVTEVFGERRPAELLRLRERLLASPGRTLELVREQLAGPTTDLVWVTLSAAHLGGHAFWAGTSLELGELPARERDLLGGGVEEIYREVDRVIGELVALLPEGRDLIITSPVGMEANTSRTDMLAEMLAAILSGRSAEPDRASSIWALRDRVPNTWRRRVASVMPDGAALELTARLELRGYDWERTRAFAHPSDSQGYVRLNLRGRERDGIVSPEEAPALIAEIEDGLRGFRLSSGAPVVASFVRTAEAYEGRHLDRLPDLVVQWSPEASVGPETIVSERFGTVRRPGAGSGRSGNHPPGGAWAILDPATASLRETSRPARVEDVAVTVLSRLGVERGPSSGEPLLSS